MPIKRPDPIRKETPITEIGAAGKPSNFFIRQWEFLLAALTDLDNVQNAEINAGTALDGGGNLSNSPITIDHADSAVTPATYGDATNVPQLTVDQQGHVTGVTNVAIAAGGGGLWWADDSIPLIADFGAGAITQGLFSATSETNGQGGLIIVGTPTNTTSYRGLFKTAPTKPFTVTAKILVRPRGTNAQANGHFAPCGIFVRDSSSGDGFVWGVAGEVNGGGATAMSGRFSDGTTALDRFTGSGPPIGSYAEPGWIRITVASNSDVECYVSSNGEEWLLLTTVTAANAVGTGLDQIGLGISRRTGGAESISLYCQYYVES